MKLALLMLTLLSANAAFAQDSPEAALRKGVVQEEVDRNLNAAIQTYQSVAARSKEDRQAAATALFRMAECYRKLGKSSEAVAAYNRVTTDFADQKKLAFQSHARLTLLAPLPPAEAPPSNPAEARNRFRKRLEEGIASQQAMLQYKKQQVQLGAIQEFDTYDAQATVSRLQGQLAAFDAGLIPKQASSPHTPQAQKAREDYRKSLVTAVEFAEKNYLAALQNYQLGVNQQIDVIRAGFKLSDVETQLAAFDAGLSYTPMAGALAP